MSTLTQGVQNSAPAKTEATPRGDRILERIEQILLCVAVCAFVLDRVGASTSASHLSLTHRLEYKPLEDEHTEMLSVVLRILKGSD